MPTIRPCPSTFRPHPQIVHPQTAHPPKLNHSTCSVITHGSIHNHEIASQLSEHRHAIYCFSCMIMIESAHNLSTPSNSMWRLIVHEVNTVEPEILAGIIFDGLLKKLPKSKMADSINLDIIVIHKTILTTQLMLHPFLT